MVVSLPVISVSRSIPVHNCVCPSNIREMEYIKSTIDKLQIVYSNVVFKSTDELKYRLATSQNLNK